MEIKRINKEVYYFITLTLVFLLNSCLSLRTCHDNIEGRYYIENKNNGINYLDIFKNGTYSHHIKKDGKQISSSGNWEIIDDPYCKIRLFKWENYNEKGLSYEKRKSTILYINGNYLDTTPDGNDLDSFKKNEVASPGSLPRVNLEKDKEIENRSEYYLSLDENDYSIYEVVNDRINCYKIMDSLFIENVAHIDDLKKDKKNENIYSLKLDNINISLKSFYIDNVVNINNLYNNYWQYEETQIWKRFIPKFNRSVHSITNKYTNTGFASMFFHTNIYNYFNKFNFIQIHGSKPELYVITALNNDDLALIDIHKNIGKHLFLKKTLVNIDVIGEWELTQPEKINQNIFTKFTLFKGNIGVINNGFYKDSVIYYFPLIEEKIFYIIIRNDELFADIFKMNIDSLNPDKITSSEIIKGVNMVFIKK